MTSASITTSGAVLSMRVPAWAWVVAVAALVVGYVLLQDNGLVTGTAGSWLHEFTHDARHALGAPCH